MMNKLTKKMKAIILILIFLIVSVSGILLLTNKPADTLDINAYSSTNQIAESTPTPSTVATQTPPSSITVNIKGEVNNPGVYTLNSDARLNDAVAAAGGFTKNASEVSVNLALLLNDQDEIIIPSKSSSASKASSSTGGSSEVVKRVSPKATAGQQKETTVAPTAQNPLNINTATAAQLQLLPGIGEKLSVSILEYRQQNGLFATVEEIMKVSGIGEKRFEAIKDLIYAK